MRVAFDVRPLQYRGSHRGIGRYTLELARALLLNKEVELFWLAEPNRPLPTCLEKRQYLAASGCRPPLRQSGFLVDELQAARWNRFPVDLIHLTSGFDLSFGWPIRCHLPKILTVYDLFSVQYPLPGWRKIAFLAYAWMAHKMSFASHLLCISRATQQAVGNWLGRRCPPVSVTPLGVQAPETEPDLQRPAGDYLLLFPCWPAHKNVAAVISALKTLGTEAPPLVLAGDLPDCERQRIQSQAGQLALHWTGRVSEAQLQELYRGCRGLLFPSLYEGFGLTILEAQRCGVPVAVSNRSPMNEVVPQPDHTFDPLDAEAIRQASLKLWQTGGLPDKRHEALVYARQFNWQNTAELTVQAYREAWASTKRRV